MKILIVEDDLKVGQFVSNGLAELDYSVRLVRSCEEAREILAENSYDAIVLDLGLPDGDGLDLLKSRRESGFREPVLILSARDAVEDRVRGLNLGADDYLPKPFSFEELLARLRSLLRRQSERKPTVLTYRGLSLDLLARVATVDSEEVRLTSREFALLELFMQNVGRVLTRAMIAEKIWGQPYGVETNLIDVYVRKLRQKFERGADRPFFKTVRGTGYQMIP